MGKIAFISVLLFLIVLFTTQRPSHDRDWEFGMEELPHIVLDEGGSLIIHNFRNFDWHDEGGATAVYETRQYNFEDIETVDVFISHFDDFEGLAHIFVSFGVAGGEYIVFSLETRREEDETFSPILGLLRQYEIIYIVGSEEDIVGLRTDVRDERVYLYPTIASKEKSQELFKVLTENVNEVHDEPQIYNTLTHNCTNEITRRVEDISDYAFPLTWKSILPGYFDEVLVDMGLVDSEGEFEDIKKRHLIDNDSVDRHDKNFSLSLRKNITQN